MLTIRRLDCDDAKKLIEGARQKAKEIESVRPSVYE